MSVADEATARSLERYFKSGSGKAFANKRLLGAKSISSSVSETHREDDGIAPRPYAILRSNNHQ
jgi:hypothetical protein